MDPQTPPTVTSPTTPIVTRDNSVSQIKRWKYIAGFLCAVVLIQIGIMVSLLKKDTNTAEIQSVFVPTVSTTPTKMLSAWKTYEGEGFTLQYPEKWNNLENACSQISISKSSATELSKSIATYASEKLFGGDIQLLTGAIENAKKEFPIPFPYVNALDVVVVGPTGEGEINNVILRGPQGSGYYHIAVLSKGPSTSQDDCTNLNAGSYKEILKSFIFKPVAQNTDSFVVPGLHISFTLPKSLVGKAWKTETIEGETGDNICFHLPENASFIIQKVYAGGAGVCSGKYLTVNATSKDFSAGRGGTFSDMSGYVARDGKIYLDGSPTAVAIETDVAKEYTNANGIKYAKFLGKNYEYPAGLPGVGSVGALINTTNTTYPGIVVYMELSGTLTMNDFDKFMNSIQFTSK